MIRVEARFGCEFCGQRFMGGHGDGRFADVEFCAQRVRLGVPVSLFLQAAASFLQAGMAARIDRDRRQGRRDDADGSNDPRWRT